MYILLWPFQPVKNLKSLTTGVSANLNLVGNDAVTVEEYCSFLAYIIHFLLGLIISGGIVKNTLRPPIPERCDPEWRKLMEECWSPDPDSRPSFTEITGRLRSMSIVIQAKGHNQARQIRPNVQS